MLLCVALTRLCCSIAPNRGSARVKSCIGMIAWRVWAPQTAPPDGAYDASTAAAEAINVFVRWGCGHCTDRHDDPPRLQTALSRLYDVANVLCAIRLIEKTSCAKYRWLGADSVAAAFVEAPATHGAAQVSCTIPPAATSGAPQVMDDAPVPGLGVLKRPRAPRARPTMGEKRVRDAASADVASARALTPGTAACLAPLGDGSAPHTSLVDAAGYCGAGVSTAEPAGALLTNGIATGCAALDTTPTTVLCAHDVLASPNESTPRT